MGTENLSEYLESDDNERFSATASTLTITGISRTDDAHYFYADKGANYFGFVDHIFDLTVTACDDAATKNIRCGVWALANDLDDWVGLDLANVDCIVVGISNDTDWHGNDQYYMNLYAYIGASINVDSNQATPMTDNVTYYIRVKRFGRTCEVVVYTSAADRAAEQNAHSTMSVTCPITAFRYIYACLSLDLDTAHTLSGTVANLDLQEEYKTRDIRTWTEVDPAAYQRQARFDDFGDQIIRNCTTYVYYDMGVGAIGDFEYWFDFNVTDVEAGDASSNSMGNMIAVSNMLGDIYTVFPHPNGQAIWVPLVQWQALDDRYRTRLLESLGNGVWGGDSGTDGTARVAGNTRYAIFSRSGTTATFKYYPTAADRLADTNVIITQTATVQTTAYRYIMVAISMGPTAVDPNDHFSLHVVNLDLNLPAGGGGSSKMMIVLDMI